MSLCSFIPHGFQNKYISILPMRQAWPSYLLQNYFPKCRTFSGNWACPASWKLDLKWWLPVFSELLDWKKDFRDFNIWLHSLFVLITMWYILVNWQPMCWECYGKHHELTWFPQGIKLIKIFHNISHIQFPRVSYFILITLK